MTEDARVENPPSPDTKGNTLMQNLTATTADEEIIQLFADVLRRYLNDQLTWPETIEVLTAMVESTPEDQFPAVERFFEMVSRGMVFGIATPATIY